MTALPETKRRWCEGLSVVLIVLQDLGFLDRRQLLPLDRAPLSMNAALHVRRHGSTVCAWRGGCGRGVKRLRQMQMLR